MSTNRSTALSLFLSRPKNPLARENKKISSYYAENVFTEDKLKAYLSNDAYKAYNQTISQGQKISRQLAARLPLHSRPGPWKKVLPTILIGFSL